MFDKILIANRGEIACRVIRSARKLGIKTVAVYSDADANALHVQMADEAVHIGGSAPAQSYLVSATIVDAARKTGAQAVHPGYGFLSENAEFCRLCAENDLVFIGPPVPAIEAMGSKSAAKQIMEKAGVPLLPGYHGEAQDLSVLKQAADKIGYPVLLKAVSGGGGKGMRQVHSPDEFDAALAAAKREALAGFGDDNMLVEKYLQQPRHVEVQVFCDQAGNGVYLFERDCSVQRRHQKIIEEAPAPGLDEGTREAMGEAALKAAAAVNYVGAGTVEFLLDASGEFFFMEMNTRLQVEHPVTEAITGQDLVEWQLRVAFGEDLPLRQSELSINGHAFEARIYAEDPANDFLPASGTLHWLRQPQQTDVVRVDTGVVQGDDVGVFYDPMIAKLIVWGNDRSRALKRLRQALAAYQIVGVSNNIEFLQSLATHEAFANADLSTDFIERHNSALFAESGPTLKTRLQLAGVYLLLRQRATGEKSNAVSPWESTDYWRMNGPSTSKKTIVIDGSEYTVTVELLASGDFLVRVEDEAWQVSGTLDGAQLTMTVDGTRQRACVVEHGSSVAVFAADGVFEFAEQLPDVGEAELHDDGSRFKAPMNGTVVDLLVACGDSVKAGDTLVIMEAMKMEHAIKAPSDGRVNDVFFAKGDLVDGGADLLSFEPSDDD